MLVCFLLLFLVVTLRGIQALVQYADVQDAIKAKSLLAGYAFTVSAEIGSFTMDTQFSNLSELTIRQANPRCRYVTHLIISPSASRDFTTPGSVPPPRVHSNFNLFSLSATSGATDFKKWLCK